MKTRELVRQAQEMGYIVIKEERYNDMRIYKKDSYYNFIELKIDEVGININGELDKYIIRLATEYVNTPVEERYEELYVVRLPEVSTIYDTNPLVLTFDSWKDIYCIYSETDNKRDERFIQGFTKEEFEEIPEFYKELGVLEKC